MLVSILHRATGDGMAVIGGILLVLWLLSLAGGPESYAVFQAWVWSGEEGNLAQFWTNILGKIVLVGLSWAFFQHMCSGLRHFVLDIGAGYEVDTNNRWSMALPAISVVLTAAFWAAICYF